MLNWIIQDSLSWAALQNNCNPLINALQKLNKPFYACGVIPFEHKITGLEDVDFTNPSFFYGGTLLPILAKQFTSCGIFYEDSWWNPKTWSENRNDMLNQDISISTIGELRKNWINEPIFIKPIAVKEFTGMVLEGPDKKWWYDEYSELKDDLEICVSPTINIEKEWRFWIIDGKVITGSLYKTYGYLTIKEPASKEIYEMANEMSHNWLPNKTIVMDVALLSNNTYKIVEFNSINSSGFYNANIEKIILALEDLITGKNDQ